jgi:peptidoglycan hydrolase-like protein with peptidoglycan-binding domain
MVPKFITELARTQKRLTLISLILAAVVVLTIGAWLIGSRIKSPAEIAAEVAPPPASPILVPVEKRVLTSDIVTRGTARFGLPQGVFIPPSAAKPLETLVTSLPLPNAEFKEGQVAFTIGERPMFVMAGTIPAFRDMTPDTIGDDVKQLEQGLKRLGFYPGIIDGRYDGATAAAVAAWYTKSGWSPFEPTVEQQKELHTLQEQLALAEKDALVATLAASPKLVEAIRAKAVSITEAAQADVEVKTIARSAIYEDSSATGEVRAKSEVELKTALSAVTTSRREGALAVLMALNTQKVAQREVAVAQTLASRIAQDLDRIQRKMGIQVPANEIMFVSSLPARVKQVDVAVGAPAKGPVLTVTNDQIVIDASLPLAEAALVKPDMSVKIDEADLGIAATGIVTKVADAPGTNGVDGFHVYLEVTVDPTPTTLAGTSLRLTIPIESTKGEVIVVPINAVSLSADGTSRVQVDKDGSLTYVTVTTGLSANGFVEVTPVAGTLTAGQMVVIGFT